MGSLNFNSDVIDAVAMPPSIEHQSGLTTRVAFTINSQSVFEENVNIVPTIIDDNHSYMPWGGDKQPLAHQPNRRCFRIERTIFANRNRRFGNRCFY